MSLEVLDTCPVCGEPHFDTHLKVKDHSVSHGTFTIVRCEKCDFLFTNPRPPEDKIGIYYDSADYISHHDDGNTLIEKIYNRVRQIAVKEKLKLIAKKDQYTDKEILDIGCGTGFFLKTCKEKKWSISGTEPDKDAREIAIKNTGAEIYQNIFCPALENKQFSTITMWHVLEHVHQLNESISWIYQHLKPKGILFVAVPNPESYDAKVFKEYWAAYDVPRHLYHFTKKTMEKIMSRHNFIITDVKCMLFDSYYVSMLSNQYKNGKSKPVSSFLTGSLSNIKGLGTNQSNANSSSIIYILQKK